MVKKWKIKKEIIIFLFIFFLLFFFFWRAKSYEINYQVQGIDIIEKYNKKEKIYQFIFKYQEQEYLLTLEHKYVNKKKLIDNISAVQKDNMICLLSSSKKLNLSPVCSVDGLQVSYYLLKDEDIIPDEYFKTVSTVDSKFQNINIHYLDGKKYLIWNYKEFLSISNKGNKSISLFQNDVYTMPLAMQVNDYIILANYDNQYEFNKFYVLNSKNDKVSEIHLEKNLSFESYFLGSIDNSAYFVDKKNKREYEINIKKSKVNDITKKNNGKLLVNSAWEQVTMNSLATNEKKFSYDSFVNYEIIDNMLYRIVDNYKVKLSLKNVKKIVKGDNTTVYYLVDDSLYFYNDFDGEILLLTNFEWNFNYKNVIFIF